MLAKLWRDPVWSKVIASAVLAVIAAAWTTARGAWPTVGSVIASGWAWLGRTTNVVNWLLILLSLCALAVLAVVAVVAWVALFERPTTESAAAGATYTGDEFYGVRWRWQYGADGRIRDLAAFCRKCDYQLQPVDGFHLGKIKTVYRCDDCGHEPGLVDGSPYDVEDKVKRKIQKHLRNDSWPRDEA